MTQVAAEMLIVPLNELDRADIPRPSKDSLRKSIVAIATAYAEDDDPHKVAPNADSFTRLLKFLEHPHRWPWPTPALAVNPEGNFSAIWDDPGVHRWIVDFPASGKIKQTYLRTFPDGKVEYSEPDAKNEDEVSPPYQIR